MTSKLEIYRNGEQQPIYITKTEFHPITGDLINILGVTWEVLGRSFTIDMAGSPEQSIRCNIIVKEKGGKHGDAG